jgi:hypothetical protein
VIGGERKFVRIGKRAFDINAANRVRAVEYEDGEFHARGFFHHEAKRGDVSVEARADVLNVENERIEVFKLFGARAARLAVKRINRQSRLLIAAVGNLVVEFAAYAVFR